MSDTDEADELQKQADQAFDDDHDYQRALDLYLELLDHPGLYDNNVRNVQWRIAMSYLELNQADLALQYFQEGHFDENEYKPWLHQATGSTDDGDGSDDSSSGDDQGDGDADGDGSSDQASQPQAGSSGTGDVSFDDAVSRYGQGDYQGAADAFAALAQKTGLKPDRLKDIKWNLGMSLFKAGDQDAAEAAFRDGGFAEADYTAAMSAEMAPETPTPTAEEEMAFTLAYDAYSAKNYSYAAELYERLVSFPSMIPRRRDIYWNLGMCRFQLGDETAGRAAMAEGGFEASQYETHLAGIVAERAAPTTP